MTLFPCLLHKVTHPILFFRENGRYIMQNTKCHLNNTNGHTFDVDMKRIAHSSQKNNRAIKVKLVI